MAEIHHGPWVETSRHWFVEGAWSGAFDDGGMLEASYSVGTGGRAEGAHAVFCSPTSLCSPIQSLRVDDDLYVSNSTVFLLTKAGDEPDPLYPYYPVDWLRHRQAGILRHEEKRLHTARGRHIVLHDHCSVAIGADLSIRRIEKPVPVPPLDFGEYVGQLEDTIGAVQANAAASTRRHCRYRPVATLSRGYDSAALAVLMRRLGAAEAITFTRPAADDGTAIAEALGYRVAGYDPSRFRDPPGAGEAEFHATPRGGGVVMAVCERQLVGALLVTGQYGDRILATEAPAAAKLYNPRVSALSGTTMEEFRLRVGFLQMLPYYHGASSHPEAIHRISTSAEMKPWSVGGSYDRPIPRRILEEAGIPRGWFGHQKHATAQRSMHVPGDMSPEGAADFLAYRQTMPAVPLGRRAWHRCHMPLWWLRSTLRRGIGRLCRIAGWPAPPRSLRASRYRVPIKEMDFAFHWGCASVRRHYE